MTGLDTAIASLLASRTELLLSAIRAPNGVSGSGVTGASVGQTTTQTDMSQTVGTHPGAATPAASAQTAFSSVARTLDVISRFPGATPALTNGSRASVAPRRSATSRRRGPMRVRCPCRSI
ncbi:hypothetical protein [Caballeronia sp. S22]|uniref:hypothetical protein n=1 Tax=Caballeronia sp. S22 TaxID=3137182 RepID=UPI003530E103